jgi:hypothetical protein
MVQEIEDKGLVMKISEYGKVKRQYHDTDYNRFINQTQDIIREHLDRSGKQATNEVKNITIHIYTY